MAVGNKIRNAVLGEFEEQMRTNLEQLDNRCGESDGSRESECYSESPSLALEYS